MIDNLIYGLGTLAFFVLITFLSLFALLVLFGITAGAIESFRNLRNKRKGRVK